MKETSIKTLSSKPQGLFYCDGSPLLRTSVLDSKEISHNLPNLYCGTCAKRLNGFNLCLFCNEEDVALPLNKKSIMKSWKPRSMMKQEIVVNPCTRFRVPIEQDDSAMSRSKDDKFLNSYKIRRSRQEMICNELELLLPGHSAMKKALNLTHSPPFSPIRRVQSLQDEMRQISRQKQQKGFNFDQSTI